MKKQYYILAGIFIFTLAIRLFFAFQTPYFSSPESYLDLRLTQHISSTGLPLINDELSFGGRTLIYSPLFHYTLSFFNIFLPLNFLVKLIPNLLASSLVFIIFLITKKITNNTNIALFSSLLSSFIPIFISTTTTSISIYSLMIPLMFLSIYFLMDIRRFKTQFIITIVIISLLHPSSLLLVLGLLVYILLIKLSNLKQDTAELEAILFSTVLITWITFLLYKQPLLIHGPKVIWQNIPNQVLRTYFSGIMTLNTVTKISVLPLVFGVFTIFKYTFKEKNRTIYLLIGLATSTFLLLWLHLIEPINGMIFLAVILTILFSVSYKHFLNYFNKTKFSRFRKLLVSLIFIIFLLSSLLPSLSFTYESSKNTPSNDEIQALSWIKENTKEQDVILATLPEGHLITSIAQRKNVIDSNFLLTKNPDQRLDDIRAIYKAPYKTDAIQLLNKYKIKYIYFSQKAKDKFNIEKIQYIDDEMCFDLVYGGEIKIYKSLCRLEER